MTIKGKVIHGKGLGRKIGFPTANILLEEGVLPESGVYASTITIPGSLEETGKKYSSITNIGPRPTVDESKATTIETHILDFDADIYEKKVVLEIEKFIRPIKKFDSIDELKNQIKKDVSTSLALRST